VTTCECVCYAVPGSPLSAPEERALTLKRREELLEALHFSRAREGRRERREVRGKCSSAVSLRKINLIVVRNCRQGFFGESALRGLRPRPALAT